MKRLLSYAGGYIGLALLWLVHGLPLSWQAALGAGIGRMLWHLTPARRHVVRRNLAACLPPSASASRARFSPGSAAA